METEVIKLLISSYFSLSKRTLIDMVPKGTYPLPLPLFYSTNLIHSKAIMLNLVFNAKEDLQRELLAELYKPEVINDILQESETVVTRRKECVKMIKALQTAEEITASVSPLSPHSLFFHEGNSASPLGLCS